jgi:DNA repair exonuclease SbcCD ATPase subunit
MQQRPNQDQQAQHLFQEEGATQHRAQPELEASVLRFWETVRKTADTIVTLRQENARLQANAAKQGDSTELRAEIAALKADAMMLRAANEQLQTENHSLTVALATEQQREPVVVESPVNAELQAEAERLRAANAALALELDAMQTRLTEELTTAQTEPIVVESPVNQELEAEIEQLRADLASIELQHTAYALQIKEQDEVIVDLQATLADQQRAATQAEAIFAEPVDADHERELIAIEALQERLRELEPLAQRHGEHEAAIVELEAELTDVKEQLQRAMSIVQRYREAGLRHIEDPTMAAQMTLFAPAMPAAPVTFDNGRASLHSTMSKEDILALADRLDNVAMRIGGLFGIS